MQIKCRCRETASQGRVAHTEKKYLSKVQTTGGKRQKFCGISNKNIGYRTHTHRLIFEQFCLLNVFMSDLYYRKGTNSQME